MKNTKLMKENEVNELPEIIPADYGIGVEFTNESGTFISVGPLEDIRRVVLSIHSWAGISAEASHYYASLKTYNLDTKCLKTNSKSGYEKVGRICHRSGYFPRPTCVDDIRLDCERPLTQIEIDEDPDRRSSWEKAGDPVTGFFTEEEAIQAGIDLFHKRFSKELGKNKERWVLYNDTDYSKPIA